MSLLEFKKNIKKGIVSKTHRQNKLSFVPLPTYYSLPLRHEHILQLRETIIRFCEEKKNLFISALFFVESLPSHYDKFTALMPPLIFYNSAFLYCSFSSLNCHQSCIVATWKMTTLIFKSIMGSFRHDVLQI